MSKKSIELRVTFEAVYKSSDEYIPADEVTSVEEMTLTIPHIDSKFVVLPKVLEGITDRAITALGAMVSEYYRKQAEEKKLTAELAIRPTLWSNGKAEE